MSHNGRVSLLTWQGAQNQLSTRQHMTWDREAIHKASKTKLHEITFMFEMTSGLLISVQQQESCWSVWHIGIQTFPTSLVGGMWGQRISTLDSDHIKAPQIKQQAAVGWTNDSLPPLSNWTQHQRSFLFQLCCEMQKSPDTSMHRRWVGAIFEKSSTILQLFVFFIPTSLLSFHCVIQMTEIFIFTLVWWCEGNSKVWILTRQQMCFLSHWFLDPISFMWKLAGM